MAAVVVHQCVSCGGIYRPLQADGTSYFHTCPDGKVAVPDVLDPVTGAVKVPRVLTPTPNPRDENVKLDATGKAVVKLGDPNGFTVVVDPLIISKF